MDAAEAEEAVLRRADPHFATGIVQLSCVYFAPGALE